MIRPLTPLARAALIGAGAVILLCAGVASAQTTAAIAPQTYSLSQEQKDRLLAANTESSAERAQLGGGRAGIGNDIHGEVGGFIGTGGARGVFGTAAVPLGDNAGAILSFERSRFGDDRRR